MEILGIVLVVVGVCLTIIRLPLPLNLELGSIRSAWVIGPVLLIIGGLLWGLF